MANIAVFEAKIWTVKDIYDLVWAAAVCKKSEREQGLQDPIRRLLALLPKKRTNFGRKRIGPGASCL